ncbi:hypothetical protein [uncultured Clostridium sp.]|uniref:hypothetical protein n=1 Tax=uncultured Clostridium sp. TaxID=59620 RepID=UPI0026EB7E54|nr:hypothetical protein [uncultured Clostridium sp.]
MIVSAFAGVGKTTLAKKYNKDVIDLESGNFKWLENGNTEATKGDNKRTQNPRYPINYLEAIKKANSEYKVVLISQHEVIRKCLDAVKLDYTVVYPDISMKQEFIERYQKRGNNEKFINLIISNWEKWISDLDKINNHNKIILQKGQYLEDYIDVLGLVENKEEIVEENKEENKEELSTEVVENVENYVENSVQKIDKNVSISDVVEDEFYIDDLMLRELKSMENNVRAGMLVQAKNRLKRVDKMLNTLNVLEDELFDRFEREVSTMRTNQISDAIKLISDLISSTNSMIMSVIGNPKLQNFFIVDNSSNINIEEHDKLDINQRKKVRHAVQVVLSNIDKVEEGKTQDLKDPNIIIGEGQVVEEESE